MVMAAVLLPISVVTVVFNIKPFCFAILGYLVFKESVDKVEILGMVVCFGALIGMAYYTHKSEEKEAEETDKE